MSYRQSMDVISKLNDQFRYYKSVESLFELDQWSGLPELGGAYRQQMSAFIGAQKAGMFRTEEAAQAAEYFSSVKPEEIEDPIERGLIRTFQSRYRSSVRVPEELMRQYNLLRAEEMAEAWNDKYEQYLGIRPSNDTEGVLQDMHWAGDYIGYFQSYALGNIYDGQIRSALLQSLPGVYEQVAKGDFSSLNQWMKENIWQYGCCYTSGELMQRLTGKALDAKPFLQYLEEKYGRL